MFEQGGGGTFREEKRHNSPVPTNACATGGAESYETSYTTVSYAIETHPVSEPTPGGRAFPRRLKKPFQKRGRLGKPLRNDKGRENSPNTTLGGVGGRWGVSQKRQKRRESLQKTANAGKPFPERQRAGEPSPERLSGESFLGNVTTLLHKRNIGPSSIFEQRCLVSAYMGIISFGVNSLLQ